VNAREVIKRPLITEQSMAGSRDGRYTFEVDIRANKVQIRQAVEEIWPAAKVARVNTMIVPGKRRRVGRSVGRRPDWKKAIVTLREGRIEFFDGLL
jgi:large subunit ribosomal protein L23